MHGADATERGEGVAPYPHYSQLAAAHGRHQSDVGYATPVAGDRTWAMPPTPSASPPCFQPAFDAVAASFPEANQIVNIAHVLEEVCKQCGTQLDGFTEGDADTAKQAQATVAAAQCLPKKNNANQLFNAELGEAANAARGDRTKRAVLAEWYGEAQAGRGPHLQVLREAQEQAARNRAAFYIARDSSACAPVDSDSSDSDDDEIVFQLLYAMEMREMRDAQEMQDNLFVQVDDND